MEFYSFIMIYFSKHQIFVEKGVKILSSLRLFRIEKSAGMLSPTVLISEAPQKTH